jgi:hypothetical protein
MLLFALFFIRLTAFGEVPALDAKAVAELRERGPAGLDLALAEYDQLSMEIEKEANRVNTASLDEHKQLFELQEQRNAVRAAIDQIGGQRSCDVSRLYWYTDLAKAQAEAARTGKPILSLRMLGKLTDEFSCANSRFFRTSLYSNKEISDYLRDNFVLHWQSVRPVPRVTIDFGDGRKLERTLTGNSAHYVLSATGQPLDVLPGLYSPQQFTYWLVQTKSFHDRYLVTLEAERAALLAQYHDNMQKGVLIRWNMDIGRLGEAKAAAVVERIDGALSAARAGGQNVPAALPKNAAPEAVKAARLAPLKADVERPIFRLANLGGKWMESGMDDDLWQAVANLHRDEVKLDRASVTLMRREFPKAARAGALAMTKRIVEDPMLRVVRAFEDSISLDTVRNEYLLHRRIHEQFASGEPVTGDVDKLNEWVYAELFLTPSSDPWLGLAPSDVYTALENGGQVAAK